MNEQNQNQNMNDGQEPMDLPETQIREIDPIQEHVPVVESMEDMPQGAEPMREDMTQNAEPIREDMTQNAEPIGEDMTQNAEPIGEDMTQNAEPMREDMTQNAEPIGEDMMQDAEPMRQNMTQDAEHVKLHQEAKEKAKTKAKQTTAKGSHGCYQEKVKKSKKKSNGWAKLIAGCVIVGLVGGPGIGAGYALVQYSLHTDEVVSKPTKDGENMIVQQTAVRSDLSVIDVVSKVKPSVVSITTKIEGVTQYYGAFSMPYQGEGAGSGVIFYSDDEKIAIVTNNHVIANAKEVYATINDKASVKTKVIGTKEDSDLAVLTVSWKDLKNAGIEHVTPAEFGDSEQLEVGESVIAIGNAMGQGLSATDGIISMKNQTIALKGNPLAVVQTSAAINGGNSGGALVNRKGEVIGINTAKYNSDMTEGMGYAIPSNEVANVAQDLLEDGTVETPYIGVVGTSISSENASLYKLPIGALIVEVAEGGPAALAGIEAGDIITECNGKKIMDMESLSELVKTLTIGQKVSVHVIRNGETGMDITMTVADKNA